MSELLDPNEIIDAYKAELLRIYGPDIAAKSSVSYTRGWYYIAVARRFEDGSVGRIGAASAYRCPMVLQMLERLKQRPAKV
jgi:hypothetical protein